MSEFITLLTGMLGWVVMTAIIALVLHHLLKTKMLSPFVWWLGLLMSMLVFLPAPEAVVSQFGDMTWIRQNGSFSLAQGTPDGFIQMESSVLDTYGVALFLTMLALVSLWRLGRMYCNYHRVYQMVLQSIPFSTPSCAYPVYLTSFKGSAFVVGLYKPVIALPDYFFNLSPKQQLIIIAHEQTHIGYSDQWVTFFWRILTEIFWFNPFLLNLEKGFNQSMEHRCDDQTLSRYNFSPVEYAQTLLQCLKMASDINPKSTVIGFSTQGLAFRDRTRRIKLILEHSRHGFQFKGATLVLAGLALSVFSINSAFAAFLMLQEPWIYPVANPKLTSGFGHIAKLRAYKPHQGIDLRGALGTPIYASGSGKVMIADDTSLPNAYGKVIVIQHAGGWQSLYAHLDHIGVLPGERVKQGELIGSMGETGRASGVHLHFELALEGKPVDPLQHIHVNNATNSSRL